MTRPLILYRLSGLPYSDIHLGRPESLRATLIAILKMCCVVLGVSGTGGLLFSNSNGNGSLPGHQFNLWGNPTSQYHHLSQNSAPVLWPNSSSLGQSNHMGQAQLQSHAYSASHSNLMLSRHHVGSAPSGEPTLLERRHSYLGESPETTSLIRSASGTGLGGNSAAHAINIAGSHGLINLSGAMGSNSALDHASSSPNLGVMSPQHRARLFSNGGLLAVTSAMDGLADRGRNRRGESITAQADNKKQYQLDLERIMRGEDPRTTLMIKNIPNK